MGANHPFIFGAGSGTGGTNSVAIRWAYDAPSYTFWVGWGSVGTTDQTPITIKRGITDPVTGLVTEAEAFGPWDDYLTLPYS